MTALEQLASRLPPVWPTKSNMPPSWWAKFGGKIKIEDTLVQVLCDQLLGRDPKRTGSYRAVAALADLKAASLNQKKLRAAGLLLRDDNPRPLLSMLRDEQHLGICYLEQFAKYQPRLHTTAALAAVLYLARQVNGAENAALRVALVTWLGQQRWCLERFEWPEKGGAIYWIGLRRAGASEPLDPIQLALLRGQSIDLKRAGRELGLETSFPSGPFMNGGPPRGLAEWLLLAAGERGLLAGGIEPIAPKLAIPFETERDASRILSWFPRLHWRPGDGPILAATEMRAGWARPRLWVVLDKHTPMPPTEEMGDDVYLTAIPGEWWGFDPHERVLEAAA